MLGRVGRCVLLAALAAACNDIYGVNIGQIEITVTTTGADLDPDGYSLSLDGAAGLTFPLNATRTLTGVSTGSHSVLLSGLAPNCAVAGGGGGDNPRSVKVTRSATARVTFSITCVAITGSVAVTVATTGVELDPDGYMVRVDGGAGEYAPVNAALLFSHVLAGSHSVSVEGVAPNCTVAPGNPRPVDVVAGATVQLAFSVTCVATVGSIAVTVATTGADLDPDGYAVRVDGANGLDVGLNGSVTISGLKGGTHSVLLADVAANCVPDGTNPRSVDVVAGQTVQVAFAVSCAATTGALRITTSTTGVDLPGGYSVSIDGAAGPPPTVPVNGTVTVSQVLGGSRTVTLSGVPSNCAVSGDNPRPVTITIGETTTVAFTIQCVKADRIAFVSNGENYGNYHIYVMNADGSGVAHLTYNAANDAQPAWSTDGTKIAFQSDRDGNVEIYLMNADGSGVMRLTNNGAWDGEPSWSPDGARLAFVSNRDRFFEIYVMNADGSGQVRVTSVFADNWDPAWSPDGSKIAFMSTRDGNAEIYVMNADGSGVTRLTNNSAADAQPAWSPDGTKIAFTSKRDADYQIYVMNSDGSGVTRLTNDADQDLEPAWSPNGSAIAFTKVTESCGGDYYGYYCDIYSTVNTMKADGSGLKSLWFTGADSEPAWRP